MKKILYSLLFLSQLTQAARGFEIFRLEEGGVALLDESCDKATKIVKSLDQWTKNSHEKKDCAVNFVSPTKIDDKCGYDITNCVPNQVVEYVGSLPQKDGPNCWNLALVMRNILPALRYSEPAEMKFYMSSPLCRQLSPDEEKIPGDIGAIRESAAFGNTETHGFIYISKDVVYSKNGFDKQAPYMLLPLESMFSNYNVPDDDACKFQRGSKCSLGTDYFRCMSMEEYLATQKAPKQIISTLKEIDKFDSCLQGSTFTARPLSKESKKSLIESLNAISNYLYNETEKPNKTLSEKDKFLLGSLTLKINSIGHQLNGNEERDFANAIDGFSEHLHTLTYELQGINVIKELDEKTQQIRYRVK